MSSYISLPQIDPTSIAQGGATNGQVLTWNGTVWAPATGGGGGGGVSSVGLSSPGVIYSVSGSPVTSSGTLALNLISQSANQVLAGPTSGAAANPTFRSLVAADVPNLPASNITGLAPSATTDTTNATNITSGSLSLGLVAQGGAASGNVLTWSGSAWAPATAVSSVALGTVSDPIYTVSGSPVTTSGTLTLTANSQTSNFVLAAPNGSNGVPTFRALQPADSPVNPAIFGDGSDGAATITTAINLGRDMYYTNLTISTGGSLRANGNRIFVSGILDISNTGGGGIIDTSVTKTAVAGTTAGTGGGAGSASNTGSLGGSIAGVVGGAGGTAAGSQGTANTGNNVGLVSVTGGSGGAGGLGSGGAGGAQRTVTTGTYYPFRRVDPNVLRGATLLNAGASGAGGSGGGGDGTSGGGGGGGAAGGGPVMIFAKTINRDSVNTAANAVTAFGGNGGAGGAATAGNRGGGGGGGGGTGGWVYIAYGNLTGTATTTGAIKASGGTGGAGGAGFGTGVGGNGGNGGGAGEIILINLTTGVMTVSVGGSGSAGGTASGTTGGTSGNAAALAVNF